jgi:hypothetical protein
VDEERKTDPEVDEQQSATRSPIEEEYRESEPHRPEVREVTTFMGIGVGVIFAVLLGLFAILTVYLLAG